MSVSARAALAACLLGVAIGAATLLGVLAGARAAATAVTVRVDIFPDQPRAGDVATVQLRPFASSAVAPPALQPKNFPWRVAAISRAGGVTEFG